MKWIEGPPTDNGYYWVVLSNMAHERTEQHCARVYTGLQGGQLMQMIGYQDAFSIQMFTIARHIRIEEPDAS